MSVIDVVAILPYYIGKRQLSAIIVYNLKSNQYLERLRALFGVGNFENMRERESSNRAKLPCLPSIEYVVYGEAVIKNA